MDLQQQQDLPYHITGARKSQRYGEENHDHSFTNPQIRPSKHRVRLWLVRHAESAANVDKGVNTVMSDHAIPLSDRGIHQAMEAGQMLKALLESVPGCGPLHRRVWLSPYKRTRQTAAGIIEQIGESQFGDVQESVFLGEQQFGLFEGLGPAEVASKFPEEHRHFDKAIKHEGRFWARMPLGESRFDVCARVGRVVDQIVNDEWHHGICDVIVVSHGLTLRAFAMMWLGRTAEWMDKEPNPNNCSIRLFEGTEDRGYVFEGFSDEKTKRDIVAEHVHGGINK